MKKLNKRIQNKIAELEHQIFIRYMVTGHYDFAKEKIKNELIDLLKEEGLDNIINDKNTLKELLYRFNQLSEDEIKRAIALTTSKFIRLEDELIRKDDIKKVQKYKDLNGIFTICVTTNDYPIIIKFEEDFNLYRICAEDRCDNYLDWLEEELNCN